MSSVREIMSLPIADIAIGPRIGFYNAEHARRLGANINAIGQHDPIHVKRNGNAAKLPWTLVAGLHRLRGVEAIGRLKVDAIQIADGTATDTDLRRLELSENADHRRRAGRKERHARGYASNRGSAPCPGTTGQYGRGRLYFDRGKRPKGQRRYVPSGKFDRAAKAIVAVIGTEAFERLSACFSPDYIRVPLLIDLRANRYRAAGLSNRVIGRRLGKTETGINNLFRKLAEKGELLPKGSKPLANVQDVQGINRGARCFCCGHYNPDREASPEVEDNEPLEAVAPGTARPTLHDAL